MKTLISVVLGALAFAGASLAAHAAPDPTTAPVNGEGAPGTFYYWNHPKLGMVKVDRATHALVHYKPAVAVPKQDVASAPVAR